MATYSGNNDFLSIDGVDLSAFWRECEITQSVESADVTGGSGVNHMLRNVGLADHKIKITLMYDIELAQMILPLTKVGKHAVVYGKEGSTTGKPKHDQVFVFTEVTTKGSYKKDEAIVLEISGEGAAAPISDMFNGGMF